MWSSATCCRSRDFLGLWGHPRGHSMWHPWGHSMWHPRGHHHFVTLTLKSFTSEFMYILCNKIYIISMWYNLYHRRILWAPATEGSGDMSLLSSKVSLLSPPYVLNIICVILIKFYKKYITNASLICKEILQFLEKYTVLSTSFYDIITS